MYKRQSLIQRYLPSDSQWTTTVIDAVPFIVIALMLIYNLARRGRVGDVAGWGGALDRAITPQGESRLAAFRSNTVETASLNVFGRYGGPVLFVAIVGVLPLIVEGYWIGLMAQVFAYGVIFLSWTIVTGEGGMLWLCQITCLLYTSCRGRTAGTGSTGRTSRRCNPERTACRRAGCRRFPG